ncbi:MAG: EF-hand domain-containing protein [Phycisphaerae bacterium]|nr:EF-hand domain-containing protein [Phycisphaerae bacterium]
MRIWGMSGIAALALTAGMAVGQTPTDDCASAPTVGAGAYAFDTTGFTPDHWGLGTCGSSSASPDGWIKVVSAISGSMTVETCNAASYDTVLAAFDACGGSLLICTDDTSGCAGFTTRISFPVTAGVPALIRIAGFNGASGAGTLTVIDPVPPPPGTFIETGDAGQLPGSEMPVTGSGALNRIQGSYTTGEMDLYRIRICDPGSFSATTVGNGTSIDTQLWLFQMDGSGIVANDDNPAGTLQSSLSNTFTSSLPAGDYLLGISGYNLDPANGLAELIWLNTPFNVERAPDGPGVGSGGIVVAGWTGSAFAAGNYNIDLTGACFVSTCPGTGAGACSRADWNEDGVIDFNDFLAFLNDFNNLDDCADLNGDGVVDFNDFLEFLNIYNAGC